MSDSDVVALGPPLASKRSFFRSMPHVESEVFYVATGSSTPVNKRFNGDADHYERIDEEAS